MTTHMPCCSRILYAAKSNRGDEWGEHELDYILFYKVGHPNLTVEPNPNEVKDIKYVSLTELDHFMSSQQEAGHGITPWFKHISDTFLKQWWENLERIDELKNHQDVKKFWSEKIAMKKIEIIIMIQLTAVIKSVCSIYITFVYLTHNLLQAVQSLL